MRDFLRSLFGTSAEHDATKEADSEDLLSMSSASITMEASLGYKPTNKAGIAFSNVDTTDFEAALEDVEAVLETDMEDKDVSVGTEDNHGTQWIIVRSPQMETLTTQIQYAANALMQDGYGSRLLAAVFGFENEQGDRAYWIYSFNRGSFYPFVPRKQKERDNSVEFKMQAQLENELNIEDDEEYWYPMWPSNPRVYPWE